MMPAMFGWFALDCLVISCHWSMAHLAGSLTRSDEVLAMVRFSSVMFGAPEPQSMSWSSRTDFGRQLFLVLWVWLSVTTIWA